MAQLVALAATPLRASGPRHLHAVVVVAAVVVPLRLLQQPLDPANFRAATATVVLRRATATGRARAPGAALAARHIAAVRAARPGVAAAVRIGVVAAVAAAAVTGDVPGGVALGITRRRREAADVMRAAVVVVEVVVEAVVVEAVVGLQGAAAAAAAAVVGGGARAIARIALGAKVGAGARVGEAARGVGAGVRALGAEEVGGVKSASLVVVVGDDANLWR